MTTNPILVALDFDNLPDALRVVDATHEYVGGYKVGMELCTAVGVPAVVDAISAAGGAVFVDLKFKDIPNTVAGAVRALARPGVLMTNIHADGGLAMMRAAVAAVANKPHRPLLIGVTVLTSISPPELRDEIGITTDLPDQVIRLAGLARTAGLNGVVCSAHEIAGIKAACGADFITVVPGVRPAWADANDQARMMTPAEAQRVGSDYLIIGRPITRPPAAIGTPADAARRILDEIGSVPA
jgi:orotidine-5'-phosphate decarboxylase